MLRGLACASIDRVIGRYLAQWMPRGPHAATLRRLQTEAQMLLYTHPLNDERLARGELPINSFWLSGTGALAATPESCPSATNTSALRTAALHGDWPAWARAWGSLDANEIKPLADAADADQQVSLTLCGERGLVRLTQRPRTLWQSLRARVKPPTPFEMLSPL